jgi:hypothetical protein
MISVGINSNRWQPIANDCLGIGLSPSGAVQFGKSKSQSVEHFVRLTANCCGLGGRNIVENKRSFGVVE